MRATRSIHVPDLRQSFPEQLAALSARTRNLVPTKTWRDLMRGQHDRAFVVAGVTSANLLKDFASAITVAIQKGTGIEAFRKEFDALVAAYGWEYNGSRNWRTRVILRTNVATSYAAGRLAQLRDPDLSKIAPYWVYIHSGAEHPRLDHKSWNGQARLADDPWWKTHYPPNGWGCGCSVTAASERDIARNGWSKGPFPDDGSRVIDGREVPNGIGEGWDYMPGDSATLTDIVASQDLPEQIAAALSDHLSKPVSAALTPPKNKAVAKALKLALSAIDKLHSDGVLPKIPVRMLPKNNRSEGHFARSGLGKPIEVAMKNVEHSEFYFAHEIGHFIDLSGLPGAGMSSQDSAELNAVLDAILATPEVKRLKAGLARQTTKSGRNWYTYSISRTELWARAYSQWVAVKSGDDVLLRGLGALRNNKSEGMRDWQWADENFGPISAEIDALFKTLEWLR